MKYRDSGMPSEEMWDSFFSPTKILSKMEVDTEIDMLIDVGCGYGTFILPASNIIKGKVIGIDVDNKMIEICSDKIKNNQIHNIDLLNIDISEEQSIDVLKKYNGRINYISLFNILHCEDPIKLLGRIYKILNDNGKVGIIHWKYEKTPRGPSMDIRPKPEQIKEWATSVGFKVINQIDLPPYHYGIIFKKGDTK
ncbi:MAG: methyltransferase type 12 [Spirochaetes bacterium GWF1_31_7]|nr:MAG: methyltransferase type 12 [Spirochaetes bacterium GWE1_32_154]OHD48644.1 MAG: methyltransferase type 12 [Spirochaetes bacterium GWF1_31_7]OHD50226.1 MAG: methyltransferase type 12 [Spirochaetes bacterium GWE2_31_10]HBD93992.1 class I SAM-dependent methyltransferase [Spirochaetia bacterium]HBI38700.1 class I SAM-dependent methyltransferase [Spirochaetia bacterium]